MFVSFLKRVFCVDSELSGIIWNRSILAPQETEETFFKTWDPGKSYRQLNRCNIVVDTIVFSSLM